MLNKSQDVSVLDSIFILVESLIYITFIIFDIKNIDSTLIKYLGIVCCLIYALINKNRYSITAMVFTTIADFFLLVINKYYEVGVFVFIFAQIAYLYYLGNFNNKGNKAFFALRCLFIGLAIIYLFLNNLNQLLNVLTTIYFTNLIFNFIQSLYNKQYLLALGFILFICCDICVGLNNILPYNKLINIGMWIFYLPSQVLINLSIKNSTN